MLCLALTTSISPAFAQGDPPPVVPPVVPTPTPTAAPAPVVIVVPQPVVIEQPTPVVAPVAATPVVVPTQTVTTPVNIQIPSQASLFPPNGVINPLDVNRQTAEPHKPQPQGPGIALQSTTLPSIGNSQLMGALSDQSKLIANLDSQLNSLLQRFNATSDLNERQRLILAFLDLLKYGMNLAPQLANDPYFKEALRLLGKTDSPKLQLQLMSLLQQQFKNAANMRVAQNDMMRALLASERANLNQLAQRLFAEVNSAIALKNSLPSTPFTAFGFKPTQPANTPVQQAVGNFLNGMGGTPNQPTTSTITSATITSIGTTGDTKPTPGPTIVATTAAATPITNQPTTTTVTSVGTPIAIQPTTTTVTSVGTPIAIQPTTTTVTSVGTPTTTVQVLDPTSYSNTKISISDGSTSVLKVQDVPTDLIKLSGFTKLSEIERTPVEGRYGAVVVELMDHRLNIEAWRLMNVSPELKAEKEKLASMTDLTFQEKEKLKTLAKPGDKAPTKDSILEKVVGAIEEEISGSPQAKIDREIAERARLEGIQDAYARQSKIVSDLEAAQKLDDDTIKKFETQIVALEKEAAALQGGATQKGDKPALDPIVQRITGYLKQMDLMAAQLKLLKIVRAGDQSTDSKEAKVEAYCKTQLLHAIGYIKMVWGLVEGPSPAAVEQRNYIESSLKASGDYDYFAKVLSTPKTVEEFNKIIF